MIVCLCNAITEKQVEAAIREGADSAEAVYDHYDGELQCSKCLPMMQDLVNHHLGGQEHPDMFSIAAE